MTRSKGSSSTVFFLAILLVAGGGAGLFFWLGERGSSGKSVEAAPPIPQPATAPTGEFLHGGRPKRDGPARELFREDLPTFIIELDRHGRASSDSRQEIAEKMKEARAAVLAAAARSDLSDRSAERLRELVDACVKVATANEDSLDEVADRFNKSALALNDSLATDNLGFFVDGDVLTHRDGTRSVLLFSFEVMQVILYRSLGHDIRTLRLRRLDQLNWRYNLLGFTSPDRHDAVVLDKVVDEHLIELVPALGDDPLYDPFRLDKEDTYFPWYQELRKLTIANIRDELAEVPSEKVRRLGELLSKRKEILRDWKHRIEGMGYRLSEPTGLEMSWNYRQQMQGLVTKGAMDELDEIQNELMSEEVRTSFEKVHDHLALSVERHEAQHRLDLSGSYTLPMPERLANYVGELPGGFRGGDDLPSASLAELAAYLGELARDPLTRKTNLALLAKYFLAPGLWGRVECYAALVIFEALAEERGIEHEPFVEHREIQRDRVAAVYMKLAALPSLELQSAAKAAWENLFERPLPELELIAR